MSADVDDHRRRRRRERELGAARPAEDHDQHQVERVERGAGGERADDLVRLEEALVGQKADEPRREQPQADHRERDHGDEPRDDQGVGAPRLVVVGDRVRERRPRQVEAADQDLHPVRELDRERIQARLGEAGKADDDDPVEEGERVERQLGRHRRQPEAEHPAKERHLEAKREPLALDPQAARQEEDAGPEAAEEDRRGAEVRPHHERDRDRDRHQHLGDRVAESRAAPARRGEGG